MKKIIQVEKIEYVSDISGTPCKDCSLDELSASIEFSFGYGEYPDNCPDEIYDGTYGEFHFTRDEAIELWKILKEKFPRLQLKQH